MSSIEVRLLLCDESGCIEEFIDPAQYSGKRMPSRDQLRSLASKLVRDVGWVYRDGKDFCPVHRSSR